MLLVACFNVLFACQNCLLHCMTCILHCCNCFLAICVHSFHAGSMRHLLCGIAIAGHCGLCNLYASHFAAVWMP
jgi:hypothetical protein